MSETSQLPEIMSLDSMRISNLDTDEESAERFIAVFHVEFSRLITEDELKGSNPDALDMEAAITVVSPRTLSDLSLAIQPWDGSRVKMASRQRNDLLGAVQEDIDHSLGRLNGKKSKC